LVLTHWHNYWLNPTFTGTTFQAGITTLNQGQDDALQPPDVLVQPNWEMQIQAQPAAGVQASVQLGNMVGSANAIKGSTETWGNQFSTSYTLANPDVNVLLPVATESITIAPAGK
jgi:hypothetical protein